MAQPPQALTSEQGDEGYHMQKLQVWKELRMAGELKEGDGLKESEVE